MIDFKVLRPRASAAVAAGKVVSVDNLELLSPLNTPAITSGPDRTIRYSSCH
jgi:hypothetical protein